MLLEKCFLSLFSFLFKKRNWRKNRGEGQDKILTSRIRHHRKSYPGLGHILGHILGYILTGRDRRSHL